MSVPPSDLDAMREFDTPDIVTPAFRRFRLWLGVVLVAVAATAGYVGYSVDKVRTQDLSELLRRADALHTEPLVDDPLPYFMLHGQLASAAGVESCSAFAIRMTQRFVPEGFRFAKGDVERIQRGGEVAALRVYLGDRGPIRWQC